VEQNLVIVALNYLGTGVTVTPPMATGADHPAWVLINIQSAGSPADFTQLLYWHVIGNAETGAPQFLFSFDSSVRATAGGVGYQGTCLEDAGPPCGPHPGESPVDDAQTSAANASNSVPAGAALNVPANGVTALASGSSNTLGFFGGPGSPSGTVSAGLTARNEQQQPKRRHRDLQPVRGLDGHRWAFQLDSSEQ
jgi:hypothetical protein